MDEERYRRAEQAIWRSAGVQPTERVLPLERTSAQVRVQEVGSGQPVVLVHGAMNAGTSWASLVARLEGFRCIMIDRPGCGLSPRLARPPVTMENLGVLADSLIVDVLDALDIEQSHLIGTSFGGYFALRTAAAHPRRITRLVTLSWSFGAPTIATPLVMRIAMVPVIGGLMLRIRPNERMVRAMLKQIGLRAAVESGRFGPVEIAWYLSLMRDTDTMRTESDGTPPVATWRGINDATVLHAAFLD